FTANIELAFQNEEKEKRAAELVIANTELNFQNDEKENRASELFTANIELAFQNDEKEKRAAELVIANTELNFQNDEKEKRASELLTANIELAFQNEEKEKRAAELVIANTELNFQNDEKEKRASELLTANVELAFQNKEKEKRAAELVIAITELNFQNDEKEKRASELFTANIELAFQNEEKEKRAAELVIANTELNFQNNEKENRASELFTANIELAFQNEEKQKLAAELVIANKELAYQNREKEKRAAELLFVNKELESFTFISSHDLQEPLRKIQTFSSRILVDEYGNLSTKGQYYFDRIRLSALHMQTLINDLLAYSRTIVKTKKYEVYDLLTIVADVKATLKEELQKKKVIIVVKNSHTIPIITFQFRQLLQNLISNSVKYCAPTVAPHIIIDCQFVAYDANSPKEFVLDVDHYHISICDNGIGFDPQFKDKIFDVFQRLHDKNVYEGTGIGLTIARKIVENHHGRITANSTLGAGAQFDIYVPAVQK
ncbi:sensor histidine kinase, partial [Flavobacterium sp.]